MRRNKNIASFLFSVFSAGMLSQALMGSASGTDILKTEKLVKEAKLQQNSSSTDDENIEGSSNIEEEVQDIGANDNDDANSAGMVYIDRNKVNGALANKQLIKVASILLPTLGVGALNGTAYHFLKKEDKNKEPGEVNTEVKDEDEPNEEGEKEDNKVTGDQNEVNTEVKDEDEPNEEDTKGEKEDKNKEPSEVNTEVKDEDEPNLEDTKGEKEDKNKEPSEVNTEVKDEDESNLEDTKGEKEDNKVTGNLNTSTSVWWYVIAIVVVLIIISAVYVYYRKNNESSSSSISEKKNENRDNNNISNVKEIEEEKANNSSSEIFEEEKKKEEKNNGISPIIVNEKNGNEETVSSFSSEDENENENKIKRSNTFNYTGKSLNLEKMGGSLPICEKEKKEGEGKGEEGGEEEEENGNESENKSVGKNKIIFIEGDEKKEDKNGNKIKKKNTFDNKLNSLKKTDEFSSEDENGNKIMRRNTFNNLDINKNYRLIVDEETNENENREKVIIEINNEEKVIEKKIKEEEEKKEEEKNENEEKKGGEEEEEEEKEKEDESNNKEKNNIGNEIFGSGESYGKTLYDKCDKFEKVLKKDPACVKIKGKTIVVGDLHFNTGAALFVKNYYEKKLENGDDYNLVFLGDFIDRGKQATYGTIHKGDGKTVDKKPTAIWRLKTLEIIMDLKIKNPEKVIVLSGNHEAGGGSDNAADIQRGLFMECGNAFGYGGDSGKVLNKATEAFGELPKCAVLEQKDKGGNDLNTFLVHGTVPYDIKTNLKDIVEKMSKIENKENYSIEDENNGELVKGMLWNDYKGAGRRGTGVYNLKEPDVEHFRDANNIQRVISAHDHREPYVYDEDVNYIKVITSPNMNLDGKDGFILDIDEHGKITQVKVKEISYEEFKPQGANNANNINNGNFNDNFNNIFQDNN